MKELLEVGILIYDVFFKRNGLNSAQLHIFIFIIFDFPNLTDFVLAKLEICLFFIEKNEIVYHRRQVEKLLSKNFDATFKDNWKISTIFVTQWLVDQ